MDLHSREPFWLIRSGLVQDRHTLRGDTSCDVLVIGAGITGALIAERLTRDGMDVVVVDRRRAGAGSTSASTALLIYDIDRPLHELIDVIGEGAAVRAYRMGIEAIDELTELTTDWPEVEFLRRRSLLVAQPDQANAVTKEYEARKAHGFDVDYLDDEALLASHGIHRPNAMTAATAAEVDPYRLAHRLLRTAARRGARIYDRAAVVSREVVGQRVRCTLAHGERIDAAKVVYATGYEGANVVGEGYVKLLSTFALATEPFNALGYWSGETIIWETGEPYLYLRTAGNGRVVIGGEDEPFQNAAARDAMLPGKVQAIIEKMKAMMPDLVVRPEFSWAGTFGHTEDGLPYIGEHPEHPGCLFALGYGGNGVTFSTMATWIIAAMCKGERHADEGLYAFDRPTAGIGK